MISDDYDYVDDDDDDWDLIVESNQVIPFS